MTKMAAGEWQQRAEWNGTECIWEPSNPKCLVVHAKNQAVTVFSPNIFETSLGFASTLRMLDSRLPLAPAEHPNLPAFAPFARPVRPLAAACPC